VALPKVRLLRDVDAKKLLSKIKELEESKEWKLQDPDNRIYKQRINSINYYCTKMVFIGNVKEVNDSWWSKSY
jgi:hypothetical protein